MAFEGCNPHISSVKVSRRMRKTKRLVLWDKGREFNDFIVAFRRLNEYIMMMIFFLLIKFLK